MNWLHVGWPLLFLGMAGLFVGLRGRRVGSETRCRRCGYVVDHLPSDRCPECGTTLTSKRTVRGRRVRRRGALTIAALLLPAGLALLSVWGVGRARATNWYPYYPISWVARDLTRPLTATNSAAWAKVVRREAAGLLTADDARLIDEHCFTELRSVDRTRASTAWNWIQKRQATGPIDPALTDQILALALSEAAARLPATKVEPELWAFLEQALQRGQLSVAQTDEFLTAVTRKDIRIRPKIVQGEPTVLHLDHLQRRPVRPIYHQQFQVGAVRLNDRLFQDADPKTHSGSSRPWFPVTWSILIDESFPPGKQTLHLPLLVEVGYIGADKRIRKWTKTVEYDCVFELLPRGSTDDLRLVAAPGMHEAMPESVQLSGLARNGSLLEASLALPNPPMPCAFDVFVIADGRGWPLGTITTGDPASGRLFANIADAVLPEKVDLLLRTSPAAARQTFNLTHIWDGEIRIPNVEVVDRNAGLGTRERKRKALIKP